jgi:hypothetical protein
VDWQVDTCFCPCHPHPEHGANKCGILSLPPTRAAAALPPWGRYPHPLTFPDSNLSCVLCHLVWNRTKGHGLPDQNVWLSIDNRAQSRTHHAGPKWCVHMTTARLQHRCRCYAQSRAIDPCPHLHPLDQR